MSDCTKSPKQPTLLDTGQVKAQYDEAPSIGPVLHAVSFLLLKFSTPGQSAVPLKDFIAAVPKDRVKYLGVKEEEGRSLYGIRIELPPQPDVGATTHTFDVFLDSKVNFLVARFVNHFEGAHRDESTGVTRAYNVDYVWRVTKFQDHGGGVWLPLETENREWRSGQLLPERQLDCKVLRAVVNKPLPADALDFRFPQNVLVTRVARDGHVMRRELWGPDNKPIREINTTDDLNKLMSEAVAAAQAAHRSPRTSYLWAWALGLVTLAVIVGFRVWRNRA